MSDVVYLLSETDLRGERPEVYIVGIYEDRAKAVQHASAYAEPIPVLSHWVGDRSYAYLHIPLQKRTLIVKEYKVR